MQEFLQKTQKIKATCIVQHNGKVLLLRSDQVLDPEHRPRAGYFGVPSFTVTFGADPEQMLEKTFIDYFGQSINGLIMVDVQQYLNTDQTVQVFEVVYTTRVTEFEVGDQSDNYIFVDKDDLHAYMFPAERAHLEKYL